MGLENNPCRRRHERARLTLGMRLAKAVGGEISPSTYGRPKEFSGQRMSPAIVTPLLPVQLLQAANNAHCGIDVRRLSN